MLKRDDSKNSLLEEDEIEEMDEFEGLDLGRC